MSKELEAFKNIKNITYDRTDLYGIEVFRKYLDIIETALKRLEKIDNSPKVILGRHQGQTKSMIDYVCKNWKEVKITNLEDEKKLKALEIISKCCLLAKYPNGYELAFTTKIEISKEEYDLLKEVLL